MLGKGLSGREGVAVQELDDFWDMAQSRFRRPHLPVVDGRFVHAELLSDLGLKQAEVEPALAEVVAYRNELSRIGLW